VKGADGMYVCHATSAVALSILVQVTLKIVKLKKDKLDRLKPIPKQGVYTKKISCGYIF
jgi:hypothetical protein